MQHHFSNLTNLVCQNLFSRRWMLLWGLSTAAFAAGPVSAAYATLIVADDWRDRFLRWSRVATGFAELPASTARDFLELVLHSGLTLENLSDLEPETYRGTVIEKLLLEAWYTGVFKIDGSSEFRNDETTLMWRVVGIDPPPSWCRGGPESWAAVPSTP